MFGFTWLTNHYGFILRLFGKQFVVSCGTKQGLSLNSMTSYLRWRKRQDKFEKSMEGTKWSNRFHKPLPETKVIGCKDA